MAQDALRVAAETQGARGYEDYRRRAYEAGSQFLERVDAILPAIQARAAETEALGRCHEASIEAMTDAGVFRALTPLQYGGLEMDPGSFLMGVAKIASCCSASGWISGLVSVHDHQLALGSKALQDDVWRNNVDTRVSSSYPPTGVVMRTEGGVVLNGSWAFSSGIDYSEWVIVGGLVKGEGDAAAEFVNLVVPKSDFTIDHDSWNVIGLQGTGSKTVAMKDAFVPDHRIITNIDVYADAGPDYTLNDRPLYHLSRIGIFFSTIAATALGAANGALDAFTADLKTRVSAAGAGTAVAASPFVQLRLANALCSVENVERRLFGYWQDAFDRACAGEDPSVLERAKNRFEIADTTAVCYEAIAELFEVAGGAAVLSNKPMQRFFRDLMAMRNHPTAQRDAAASAYVMARLGSGAAPPSWARTFENAGRGPRT